MLWLLLLQSFVVLNNLYPLVAHIHMELLQRQLSFAFARENLLHSLVLASAMISRTIDRR